MAKKKTPTEDALEKARELEAHPLPTDTELAQEREESQSLAKRLFNYLSPQWYLDKNKRK